MMFLIDVKRLLYEVQKSEQGVSRSLNWYVKDNVLKIFLSVGDVEYLCNIPADMVPAGIHMFLRREDQVLGVVEEDDVEESPSKEEEEENTEIELEAEDDGLPLAS